MALNLPSSIAIKGVSTPVMLQGGAGFSQPEFLGVTYGTPRVGNPAWAALFDYLVSLILPFGSFSFIQLLKSRADIRLPTHQQ